MFEYWPVFGTVFGGFVLIGFLIYSMGNRTTRREGRKHETYTCGEPFPEVGIGPRNFYDTIKNNLGIRELSNAHSGKLSDYLIWLLVGMAAMILMVMFL